MKQRSLKFSFLLFFVFFFNSGYSQYVFEEPVPSSISLHPYTTIADVGQQEFNIEFIQANYTKLDSWKLKTENVDLGFTDHHFWAKLQLENATPNSLHYYLETARPITDLVEMYAIDSLGIITKSISGDQLKFSERSFQDRKTIFKIDIASNEKLTLYFHLKSDGEVIKMPMMLRTSEDFIGIAAKEQLVFGIFYGILTTAAILYLFFFFGLKDRTFLYYS